jgi:hypothetical protein
MRIIPAALAMSALTLFACGKEDQPAGQSSAPAETTPVGGPAGAAAVAAGRDAVHQAAGAAAEATEQAAGAAEQAAGAAEQAAGAAEQAAGAAAVATVQAAGAAEQAAGAAAEQAAGAAAEATEQAAGAAEQAAAAAALASGAAANVAASAVPPADFPIPLPSGVKGSFTDRVGAGRRARTAVFTYSGSGEELAAQAEASMKQKGLEPQVKKSALGQAQIISIRGRKGDLEAKVLITGRPGQSQVTVLWREPAP